MSKFNFDKVVSNMRQVENDLPRVLANQAQNYFLKSFKEEGWEGDKWREVQRRTEGTKAYKYPGKPKSSAHTRPILIGTGRLRRAVSNCIRSATFTSVRLVVDLPYSQRHNEGLDGMPKRQFMGDSEKLRELQKQTIMTWVDKIWQK